LGIGMIYVVYVHYIVRSQFAMARGSKRTQVPILKLGMRPAFANLKTVTIETLAVSGRGLTDEKSRYREACSFNAIGQTTCDTAEPAVMQPFSLNIFPYRDFHFGLCMFKAARLKKRPRISRGGSRHLRRALYMPALVAPRRDPYLRHFYQNLIARGKARLQAVVAVMRKLLHALFAMFRTNQPYDGSKLCCAVDMAGNAIAACA
jgi:hypothetical protein